jgi:hypothetical protein
MCKDISETWDIYTMQSSGQNVYFLDNELNRELNLKNTPVTYHEA